MYTKRDTFEDWHICICMLVVCLLLYISNENNIVSEWVSEWDVNF